MPKIDVNAANSADASAYVSQLPPRRRASGRKVVGVDHEQGPRRDYNDPDNTPGGHRLAQQDQGQEDRQDRRQLVDGGHAGYVAPREGREVAQPRGPGGQARQDEKQERPPVDGAEG